MANRRSTICVILLLNEAGAQGSKLREAKQYRLADLLKALCLVCIRHISLPLRYNYRSDSDQHELFGLANLLDVLLLYLLCGLVVPCSISYCPGSLAYTHSSLPQHGLTIYAGRSNIRSSLGTTTDSLTTWPSSNIVDALPESENLEVTSAIAMSISLPTRRKNKVTSVATLHMASPSCYDI